MARLLELGAAPRTDIQDVGEGIRVADVLDPWGNVFGIIENPNFKLPRCGPTQTIKPHKEAKKERSGYETRLRKF